MSKKERMRKAIFEMVKQRRITLKQAAEQCDLSYRQTLRIYSAYLEKGDAGLIHQSRGQRSLRKHPHQKEIISLYKIKYEGFGPTLASEYLLEEDGIAINRETLRLLLLSEGLWKKQRKRSPYRKYREPCAQFGELLQIDGSIHDWFEIGEHSCLLNLVDDATGKTFALLDEGETTIIIFKCLWRWFEQYGIPLAIYVDLKNVYVSPKDKSFSHVEIACQKLGIRIIEAHSPQAKGRVERKHALYQDRLVKALRLKKIKTIEKANQYLEGGFIEDLNQKFEKVPRNANSAHKALNGIDLNQILCWEYERKINQDWTFSFNGQYFQVQKHYGEEIKPRATIKVRKHLDNSFSAWHNDKKLVFKAIAKRPLKREMKPKAKVLPINKIRTKTHWNQSNSFIYEEPDRTQAKIASMRREFALKPPKNY